MRPVSYKYNKIKSTTPLKGGDTVILKTPIGAEQRTFAFKNKLRERQKLLLKGLGSFNGIALIKRFVPVTSIVNH